MTLLAPGFRQALPRDAWLIFRVNHQMEDLCFFFSNFKTLSNKENFFKKRAKSEGGGGHTFFLSLPFLPAPTLNLSDAFCQVTMYKVLTTGSFISDFPTSENNEANRLSLFILSPACGLLLQQKRKKDSAMNMQLAK